MISLLALSALSVFLNFISPSIVLLIGKFATNAKEISVSLPNVNILGPVPWENCSGNASTIISWANHGKWKIIREGDISVSYTHLTLPTT